MVFFFDNQHHFCDCSAIMDHLEIEIKFFVSGFESLKSDLQNFGAKCAQPRIFESNVRYDTSDNHLLETGCLLRLRKSRHTTLTFKSLPPTVDNRFKTYHEREVNIDDFDAMDAILKALGFHRRQVYEKWRETWHSGDAIICMDTMPFGHFLEIEGPPDAITATIDRLGLLWHRRIIDNYLGMFERLRMEARLPFSDLTFDNFQHVKVNFDDYRHLFEVGDDTKPR